MSRRSKAAEQGTAGDVELHYTITPRLVSSLSHARWVAGKASVLALSFYGLRALQTEMMHLRIAEMTVACTINVTMKEVERVVAGDLLPPRRQAAMQTIRIATALCEAVRLATSRSKATDAETCWSYFEFAKAQPMGWAHFVGLPRGSLIDHRRKKSKPPPDIGRLYEWVDADELVSGDPILRAAALYFGLEALDDGRSGRIARMAVVDHELQAGLDPRGLLVLRNRKLGGMALRPTAPGFGQAQTTGDLTRYFQFFASATGWRSSPSGRGSGCSLTRTSPATSKAKEKGRRPQDRVIGDQLVTVDPLVTPHDVRRRFGLLAAVVDQAAPWKTNKVRPAHGLGFRKLEVGPAGLGVRRLGAVGRRPNGLAQRSGHANGFHRGLPAWRQEVAGDHALDFLHRHVEGTGDRHLCDAQVHHLGLQGSQPVERKPQRRDPPSNPSGVAEG
jgi:hypothetical protein